MKTKLFACCFVAFYFLGCSPSSEKVIVPELVKTKFKSLYPDISNPEWELEDGAYEVSFKLDTVDTSVTFSADGSILQSESEIDIALLPPPVNDYLSSLLGNQNIESAEKITDSKGIVTFEAEVSGTDYLFDANGQFIGKEEEEDTKEKE